MNNVESQAEYRRFSREELHELVWSEPMATVTRRYQMSHPAFARICSSMDIPRPDRAYWAKRKAGKDVCLAPLPARKPGQSQYIGLGDVNLENLGRMIPETPPVFPDDLDRIEQTVKRSLERTKAVAIDVSCHPAIRDALEGIEGAGVVNNRQSFDRPSTIGGAWERRALMLLNSLFWAWDGVGGEAKIVRDEGLGAHVLFSTTRVRLSISRVVSQSKSGPGEDLVIAVDGRGRDRRTRLEWSDGTKHLERQLGDIAVRVVVAAEELCRQKAQEQHQLVLEVYRDSQEMERAAVARQQQRDSKVLFDGAAEHRRAEDIRAYVDSVRTHEATCANEEQVRLDEWSSWARGIADEIDPALKRPYLTA